MVIGARGSELVYHSEPFERATEIVGFFKLSAWISIDTPDTDFSAQVYEIAADGSSKLLAADVVRARYREGLQEPKLVRTKDPLLYQFDHFPFVARQVSKGSRLRLVISPAYSICCDTSFVERNYNADSAVADESIKDARPVLVTLYHDRLHPSALLVPIGSGE